MSKRKGELCKTYDQNIIDALNKTKFPIIGVNGKSFLIREKARNENGKEHIARKDHRLKVKDIDNLINLLKHPQYICNDPDNPVYKNYYGIRKGDNSKLFIKVVTSPIKGEKNTEEIVTIYPTNSIKVERIKKNL